MESLIKNPKQMLTVTNISVSEMKNVFYGLISKLDMAKERISELEGMAIETSIV